MKFDAEAYPTLGAVNIEIAINGKLMPAHTPIIVEHAQNITFTYIDGGAEEPPKLRVDITVVF